MTQTKIDKRGGSRPGAGRPRKHEYTGELKNVTIRLPMEQIDEIYATGVGMTIFCIEAIKEKLIRDKELSS